MDDVEAAFTAAIMRTAELVIPPQERRTPGRGWTGDAQTEAELQAMADAMHAAWQRLKMDTRDAQLRRAVRKVCAAVIRFFDRHGFELEKKVRMEDQHGFFQNIKSVQLEETKKVESQCVRDDEGRLLRDKGSIREETGAILPLAAERQIRHARSRHPEETTAATSRECPRYRAHGGDCHSD